MKDIGVHTETTSKCIYCLETKPVSNFNREHVISRFMGTYENAFVLNQNQVCKECNTYFCENLENTLSLDSLEGLLRTEKLPRKMSVQRAIGRTRLRVVGQNGIFKGLKLYISSDSKNQEGIQIECAPSIGFAFDGKATTYEYFSIDTIPECTDEIRKRLSSSKSPIITIGYDEGEVAAALMAKGFDLSKAKYKGNVLLSEISEENIIETQINCKVDSLLRRLAAKNIFNFICYSYGKEHALQSIFDNLRAFIRYGTLDAPMKMFISNGGLKNIPNPKENGHIVGTAWSVIGKTLYLCGFISWFGAITYIFALYPIPTGMINCPPSNKFVICDNQSKELDLQERLVVFDWPGNTIKVGVLDGNFNLIANPQ